MRDHLLWAIMSAHLWIYAKAPFGHFFDRAHLRIRQRRADLAPSISKEFERSLGRHTWVDLTEAPCGRIARIFIFGFSRRKLRGIHCLKIGMVNIDLPANF